MSRYIKQGIFQDGQGNIVASGTVSIYLAGTSTAASVYAAESGGSAVNSITSGSDGSWSFWVDEADYAHTQKFKITLSKTNYITKPYDNIVIFPPIASQVTIDAVSNKTLNDLFDGGYDVPIKPSAVTVQAANVVFTGKQADGTSVIELKYTDAVGMASVNLPQAASKFELQSNGTRIFHFDFAGNIARIKGGSTSTNGHLIPNVTDDTFAMLAATQSFSGKKITLAAGAAGAGNAPLKFTSGTNLTTAEAGAIEYDGTYFYATRVGTTRETILTTPLPAALWPSFSVHRDGVNQSITNSSATKIQWTAEEFDTNNNFDSVTNYRFTPTAAGKYLLTATVYITGIVAGKFCFISLYKNGNEHKVGQRTYQQTTGDMAIESTWIADANGTTDYFEIYIYHDDTVARNIAGNAVNSYFMGSRVA